jgi:hypothetical protein
MGSHSRLDPMHRLTSTRETGRLILISLFPEIAKRIAIIIMNNDPDNHYKNFYIVATEKKIPPNLHNPDISGFPCDTVRLFFPDTHAFAAPFLLFRMKRRGFSSSRVTVENGSLLLTATR